MSMIPSLSFVDPWGYKGLSLKLIQAVIKDWGCEAVFFFNYNRINMGVHNSLVESHMENLFGEQRLEDLQAEIDGAIPRVREGLIRRALGDALTEYGAKYLIPFRFLRDDKRTSHYICFVTKHMLGYKIMKDVMAAEGIVDEDGVPKFEYFPVADGYQLELSPDRPLMQLPEELLSFYRGRRLSVGEVIDGHTVGSPFQSRHYKQVLRELEAAERISCQPDAASRKKNTMPDHVIIRFPK
jgi:hypothetical protein